MANRLEYEGIQPWLSGEIRDFLSTSSANRLPDGGKIWADPLVGFCRGDDPIFTQFKRQIGDFYWTPAEVMAAFRPGLSLASREIAVVSWILPQTIPTKNDNSQQKVYPSRRWAQAYVLGEKFNLQLRSHVATLLQREGCIAAAPLLLPQYGQTISPTYGRASTWSERHTAYACGLGTFGVCDGLITPVGKAMRAGSVVANFPVPPAARPYNDPHAYCLFYNSGACLKCAERCPAGAIGPAGHDKEKCARHVNQTAAGHVRRRFNLEQADCCGLCQTGVPCASRIPDPLKHQDR